MLNLFKKRTIHIRLLNLVKKIESKITSFIFKFFLKQSQINAGVAFEGTHLFFIFDQMELA